MVAEFEVHDTVVLEDRGLLALVGEVREGSPRTGMEARLEDEGPAFDAPVHGVEFFEAGEGSEPALTFSYGDDATLERWQSLDWSGRVVRLTWGD